MFGTIGIVDTVENEVVENEVIGKAGTSGMSDEVEIAGNRISAESAGAMVCDLTFGSGKNTSQMSAYVHSVNGRNDHYSHGENNLPISMAADHSILIGPRLFPC